MPLRVMLGFEFMLTVTVLGVLMIPGHVVKLLSTISVAEIIKSPWLTVFGIFRVLVAAL